MIANAMRALITRLFAEAPKMTDGAGRTDTTQAPALQCHIVLRGLSTSFQGTLSTTPEGTLRLLTSARVDATKHILMEQFFAYEDVVTVAVERQVTGTEAPRIISS